MGAFIICFLTYKVLEGNYKMIEPHLRTLCVDRKPTDVVLVKIDTVKNSRRFWSAYFALGLSRLKRTLVYLFKLVSGLQFRWKLATYFVLFSVYVGVFVPVLMKGMYSRMNARDSWLMGRVSVSGSFFAGWSGCQQVYSCVGCSPYRHCAARTSGAGP
jgi:hypothetical protein